jgi:hypothetical protein
VGVIQGADKAIFLLELTIIEVQFLAGIRCSPYCAKGFFFGKGAKGIEN